LLDLSLGITWDWWLWWSKIVWNWIGRWRLVPRPRRCRKSG